jgi:hypothetical protein
LPFNQDRYLKRNYRNNVAGIEPLNSNIEDLGPSLEELEGMPIEPEPYSENLSNYSSDDEDNQAGTLPNEKISLKTQYKIFEPVLAGYIYQTEEQVQPNGNLEEDIDFEEFNQIIN